MLLQCYLQSKLFGNTLDNMSSINTFFGILENTFKFEKFDKEIGVFSYYMFY